MKRGGGGEGKKVMLGSCIKNKIWERVSCRDIMTQEWEEENYQTTLTLNCRSSFTIIRLIINNNLINMWLVINYCHMMMACGPQTTETHVTRCVEASLSLSFKIKWAEHETSSNQGWKMKSKKLIIIIIESYDYNHKNGENRRPHHQERERERDGNLFLFDPIRYPLQFALHQ